MGQVQHQVRTNVTEGQYFPLQLKQTRLVSAASFFNWPAFGSKKYTVYDRFHSRRGTPLHGLYKYVQS